jgi:hypothetical protein
MKGMGGREGGEKEGRKKGRKEGRNLFHSHKGQSPLNKIIATTE